MKNNKDLVAKDFLDDEDTFLANGVTTVKYPECDEQNNSFAKTPRRFSVENDEANQEDVLPFSPGEQEYNNGSLQHGFKTPVLPKHNTPISSITATPCLFSPELLSQATQGTFLILTYLSILQLLLPVEGSSMGFTHYHYILYLQHTHSIHVLICCNEVGFG